MYTVYGVVASRGFRVLWALEELGVAYDQVAAAAHSDALLAVNPTGKIPAMTVDGQAITDSVAIMSFLADRHEGLTFPAGTVERARQDAMIHRLNEELDGVLWAAVRHARVLPEDRRVPGLIPTLQWEFARNIQALERDFAGPFLLGETMTVADILAVHCLNWAVLAKFPVESEALRDYAMRLSAREAYQRARAKA